MVPCLRSHRHPSRSRVVGGGGMRRARRLQNDDGTIVSLSFRPDSPYSNNIAEYEALVIGLVFALQMRI